MRILSRERPLFRFTASFLSNRGWGWRILCLAALLYIGLMLYAMTIADRIIFQPSKYPSGNWTIVSNAAGNEQSAPRFEDVWLSTADGVRIHGWYVTSVGKANKADRAAFYRITILFCHGNGGNISDRAELVSKFTGLPADVFIFDYRGYGKSEGVPSEQGVYADAQAAWDYLQNRADAKDRQIILYGESLGGAVAIELASRVHPAGLIVQSSFTSIADMAKTLLPIIPGFVIRTKMDSLSKVPLLPCPKLFIHSPADDVVPFRLGKRLFESASEPKQFYEVPSARHNETDTVGGAQYLETISRFVAAIGR